MEGRYILDVGIILFVIDIAGGEIVVGGIRFEGVAILYLTSDGAGYVISRKGIGSTKDTIQPAGALGDHSPVRHIPAIACWVCVVYVEVVLWFAGEEKTTRGSDLGITTNPFHQAGIGGDHNPVVDFLAFIVHIVDVLRNQAGVS